MGLRNRLRRVTALPRLAACGAHVTSIAEYVEVRMQGGEARLSGVQTCGSVWACPVCSASIRERRAVEVEAVATAALAAGGQVEFVTVTFSHDRLDRLDEQLRLLTAAWNEVTKGRGWRDAPGLVGYVRATEVTDGLPNGWHAHGHLLVFFDRALTTVERGVWRDYVRGRWASSVERIAGRAVHEKHGVVIKTVRLVDGRADVGEYVAKVQDSLASGWGVGREMTRGDVKRGRQNRWGSFDVAERAVTAGADRAGDIAKARWWEYEAATHGRRCLEWSRSAKWKAYLAGLDVVLEDEPDEALAEASDGGVVGVGVGAVMRSPRAASEALRARRAGRTRHECS